jgi:hypothetical protein
VKQENNTDTSTDRQPEQAALSSGPGAWVPKSISHEWGQLCSREAQRARGGIARMQHNGWSCGEPRWDEGHGEWRIPMARYARSVGEAAP